MTSISHRSRARLGGVRVRFDPENVWVAPLAHGLKQVTGGAADIDDTGRWREQRPEGLDRSRGGPSLDATRDARPGKWGVALLIVAIERITLWGGD